MGPFKQRTRLELAALLALVGTIAAILFVVIGPLRPSPAEVAERVTALCRPMDAVIDDDPPQGVTRRELNRLRQETAVAYTELRALLKDTHGDLRAGVERLGTALYTASDPDDVLSAMGRGRFLVRAERNAAALGATCPAPLTAESGAAVDRALAAAGR